MLDKPFAGLDAHRADKVAQDIAGLCEAGRALALVTHDMDFALSLCARSIVVEGGGVTAEGPTPICSPTATSCAVPPFRARDAAFALAACALLAAAIVAISAVPLA